MPDHQPGDKQHEHESSLLHAQEHKGYGSEQHWLDYTCACGQTVTADSREALVKAVTEHVAQVHHEDADTLTAEDILANARPAE